MAEENRTDYAALLKQSLIAIDKLQGRLAAAESATTQPIAIVGMACRFPGEADDPQKFWQLLREGRDAVTEVPPERWNADEFYDPDPNVVGKAYTRWGAFLKDVGHFDASFFGISPREATNVDPQHRLLLETTWESLENAGIAPSSLAGTATGVFVGITTHDYALQSADTGFAHHGDGFAASGSAHSIAAGRVSYLLDLHGPSLPVDTACSSSLVAMHLAVQSLRDGHSSVALAGGVNLTLVPLGSILTSRARMMSFDGHCKTFDETADGYVRGEGCGMVVLKRLSDARRDGDNVLAVLRGCAVNQDGRSSGMSAPNGKAQVQVIRAALADAGLGPDDIDYIEAHGTGTPLGDPIELHALGEVFGKRDGIRRLQVGSVKTNIGHLEGAAGMAGVIKSILALQNRQIPPHLHLQNPNPLVSWETLALDVPTELTDWSAEPGRVRRAGISSFGFSGTNAHLILEEAPQPHESLEVHGQEKCLLVLSAQTQAALIELSERYIGLLEKPKAPALQAVAAQALRGRTHFPIRLALAAASPDEAVAKLRAFARGQGAGQVASGRTLAGGQANVAFLFSGQGAQYAGMGRELYQDEPAFREALDECAKLLLPMLDRTLFEVLWPASDEASVLDDTRYTQPALFALEYSLTRLWEAHGVRPSTVMGHSVGEYVAACVAGVFSLEDGLRLIAARGRLMGALPAGGAMAAVLAPEAQVVELVRAAGLGLAIAAVNGPASTVVSGSQAEVGTLLRRAGSAGLECQQLRVSHAFHSDLMDPILDEFERVASTVRFAEPSIGLISNVTGRLADAEVLTARYWRNHLRGTVLFGEGIRTLIADGYKVGLEIGPHPVLAGLAKRASPDPAAVWIASLRRGVNDATSFIEAMAQLYVCGSRLDADALFPDRGMGRQPVLLPTYPFQRKFYWQQLVERPTAKLGNTRSGHLLLGGTVPSAVRIFQAEIGISIQAWLKDHRIAGLALFPAAGFIEALVAATSELQGGHPCAVEDVRIDEALILPPDDSVLLQTVEGSGPEGTKTLQLFSRISQGGDALGSGAWQLHASARVASPAQAGPAPMDIARIRSELVERPDVDGYYDELWAIGAEYGPTFRGITEICRAGRQVLGRIQLPDPVAADANRWLVHPAMLDACIQLIGTVFDGDSYVPVGVARYAVYRRAGGRGWGHVTVAPTLDDGAEMRADITIADDDGAVVAEVKGLVLHRLEAVSEKQQPVSESKGWAMEVQWRALGAPAPAGAAIAGRWLVLGGGSLGAGVCDELRSRGLEAQQVVHGPQLEMEGPVWTIDSGDRAQYSRLFPTQTLVQKRIAGIVSLWALDAGATSLGVLPELSSFAAIEAGQTRALKSSLALAQVLTESTARLRVVTRGAQSFEGAEPDLVQAPLWGLAGVVASELPTVKLVRIDLDPAAPDGEIGVLCSAICADDSEDRIVLRRGDRHVARLVPSALDAAPAAQQVGLQILERGSLSDLTLVPFQRVAPGAGQVEIAVRSIGLNFRDVLNALGMYPGDAGALGNECAGVITAVGDGVTDLQVGDEVVSMVDRCFATSVIAPAALTVPKPACLSYAEAATVPVAFLTAEYSLRHLAGIRKGDRVLIHAVTGGVGMAAAQLALRAGAEVFGTAGSDAKRSLARRMGVHHVSDSRSLAFFDDFMQATNGEGVDIVLNALSGDFIPASLRMLRKSGGHFIEIGKTGIWDEAKVRQEFPNVSYHALYLGEVAAAQPQVLRALLNEMLGDFVSGVLKPLPQRCYPLEKAEEAFRFMGQGLHVGKIVLFPRPDPTPRTEASYLLTGGLGGIGLTCAKWLVGSGARNLVLVGRSEPGEGARATIEELESKGAKVLVVRADVADPVQARRLFDEIEASMPPLAGVLHAAGVIDDAMLPEQSMARFKSVMAAKVDGAWNLHTLAAGMPLDFFVMFSSGAALLGSAGQSNYAAANCFLDALAQLRLARGLPALSINWGSWAEVGMAAGVGQDHQRRWKAMGLGMIKPDDGMAMLSQLLEKGTAAQYAALALNRERLPSNLPPFFAELLAGRGAPEEADSSRAILDRMREADPGEQRRLLVEYLSDQVNRVLALGQGQAVDSHRSILELGMDSLMAMELRNRIQGTMKIQVAVADLLGGASINEVAANIFESVRQMAASPAPTAAEAKNENAKADEPGALLAVGADGDDEGWEEGSL